MLSQCGYTERAIPLGEEAVAAARRVGAPFLLGSCLYFLGLAYQSTDLERTARLLDESLALPSPPESLGGRVWIRVAIGQLRSALGDPARALSEFASSVEGAQQSGDRFVLPPALQGMAHACRQLSRLDDAARLLAAADGLAEQLGTTGGPAATVARTRAAARLRELLGDDRFDPAWNTGRGLSFQDAIGLALDVSGRATSPSS